MLRTFRVSRVERDAVQKVNFWISATFVTPCLHRLHVKIRPEHLLHDTVIVGVPLTMPTAGTDSPPFAEYRLRVVGVAI
jgi:hypothetical protein